MGSFFDGPALQRMQRHGKVRLARALDHFPGFRVITAFAHPSHEPPPNQLYVNIDGYDYLITIEFQDPR